MDKIKERGQGQGIRRNRKEHEDRMIDEIINNFDFVKCNFAMRGLGWTWGMESMTPTISQLKSAAEKRLRDAMDLARKGKCSKSTYFSSSGGLKGNAWTNRYGQIEGIRLEFVLTDWDSDGDF